MTSDEFATQLRDRLHRAADQVPLAAAGPDQAIARARTRQRTRRGMVAGVAAVALVAGATSILTGEDGRADVATQPDAPAGEPVEFEWRTADDGLSGVRSATIDPATGVLYALSTAPGTRGDAIHPADTVYRLTDDGRWEPTGIEDDGGLPARLVASGDALYAIGTVVSDSSDIAMVVRTSGDGGATWTEEARREVEPPNRTLPWQRRDSVDIASTGDRQIAVVTTAFSVDWNELAGNASDDGSYVRGDVEDGGVRLVRETYPIDPAPSGARSGGDEVTGVEETEIGLRTWDELGLSGPEAFAPTTAAFVHEGGTWTEVDADFRAEHLITVRAVDGRFVLRTFDPTADPERSQETTRTSLDGRNWATVATAGADIVLPVGDRFAGLGYDGTVLESAGDGAWTPIDPATIDERLAGGHIGTHAAGDLGLAYTVHHSDGDDAYLVFTPDLRVWTVVPLVDILPGSSRADMLTVGADRIVVIGTDDGIPAGPGPAKTTTAVGVPRR